VNVGLLPYVYLDTIPHWKRTHSIVRVNAGGARAMRAPGHPQNCILTEFAVDDFAAKIGMDPLQVRIKNLPAAHAEVAPSRPVAGAGTRHKVYKEQIKIGAEQNKGQEKCPPPGAGEGPIKHGIGMGVHTWGGFAAGGNPPPNECTVRIARDGSITAETSSQDL